MHKIVTLAFLGEPPTKDHIVDHIDTNRQNNRPENLRYLTRLENAIRNDYTRKKIVYYCGSIESFLTNPQILWEKASKNKDKSLQWMRSVSKEEAQNCLKNLEYLFSNNSKQSKNPQSKGIGEWIYADNNFTQNIEPIDMKAISPENVRQRNWGTPSEFPLCPKEISNTPLEDYAKALKKGEVFSQNQYGRKSIIIESALTQDKESQKVIIILSGLEPKSAKPYALAKVIYEDNCFIHINLGSYFDIKSGYKDFTLEQGLEWSGGDVFDDYC